MVKSRKIGNVSLPPLHDLCAHFDQAGFCFAVGEEGDSLDGFIDVFLSQGARLFEAGALIDDFSGLVLVSLVTNFPFVGKISLAETHPLDVSLV
jgi:hypothetical protein